LAASQCDCAEAGNVRKLVVCLHGSERSKASNFLLCLYFFLKAVKACDAWVAQGLNPSPAAAVLKKLALDGGGKGDCDGEGGGGSAAVRCASYDAIASLVQFHFSVFPVETQASVSPELFSQMFTQLAQAHYSEPRY
jgi:hypothetical protein